MKNCLRRVCVRLHRYRQLTRLDRPVGIYLLLWPTLWSLWLASPRPPSLKLLAIFVGGTVLMRSAGCIVNDVADRDFDKHVKRTRKRPVTQGKISPIEASLLALALFVAAFLLVIQTNVTTVLLALPAVVLVVLYPYMKRYTHWPQMFLGLAFAWGIPMAWSAQASAPSPVMWLLFLSLVFWTVAYDTQYAMVDRDDDIRIGIKSTAILFGQRDNSAIVALQCLTVALLLAAGLWAQLRWPFYCGLLVMVLLFVHQCRLTRQRERLACFRAFQSNHWAGCAVLVGIVTDRCLGYITN